jgi:hypothetical protein
VWSEFNELVSVRKSCWDFNVVSELWAFHRRMNVKSARNSVQ